MTPDQDASAAEGPATPRQPPASSATAEAFVAALREQGYDFFVGVPCSLLSGLVSLLDRAEELHYISATREDSAVGMAVGASMAGKRPMVLMQNSGLGVAVNALSSLLLMYQTPALLVVSWRGQDGKDAPEHLLMGRITLPLLELLGIPHRVLDASLPMSSQLAWATAQLAAGRTAALVAPKGVLE
jgi:sulfopyruvate decarboxylase subunit alpha